jgi:hypothetical protein
VIVMVGDGSYLMMNSEIATSVMLGLKLTVVVLDNRGFGCINRLQQATGGAPFNNLLADTRTMTLPRHRLSPPTPQPGRPAEKVADPRRTGSGAGCARPPTAPQRGGDRHRSAKTTEAGGLVGRGGAGSVGAGRKSTPRVSPIAWANDDMPELGGDTPLEDILADIRDIGFEGVELGGKFPRDRHAQASLLKSYKLDLIGGWYSGAAGPGRAGRDRRDAGPPGPAQGAWAARCSSIAETSNAIHGNRGR